MKELKIIYKMIYDDLKDADMIIGYAKAIKEKNKEYADELIKDAQARLNHAMIKHEEFVKIAKEHKDTEKKEECVEFCLWDVTHEHYQDWFNSLMGCINSWK